MNSVVDNLQFRNNYLCDEHDNLVKENAAIFASQENEKNQVSKVIEDLQGKNKDLVQEKERVQKELELEIKTFDEQIMQKLKGFQSDSNNHLGDFHKKSQLDFEKHNNMVNDLMKTYIKNVVENLDGLNKNVDENNKNLEKVSEKEIKIMREKSPLRVFVNTPQKKSKENGNKDGSSSKKLGSNKSKK